MSTENNELIPDQANIPTVTVDAGDLPANEVGADAQIDFNKILMFAVQSPHALEAVKAINEMKDKHDAKTALREYHRAMATAKASFAPLIKEVQGYKYKYADLPALQRVVDKPLTDNGFSYKFNSKDDGEYIEVDCIIMHEGGHSTTTTYRGPKLTEEDFTSKEGKIVINAAQRSGGTITYNMRYCLQMALGIAPEKDTDAASRKAIEATAQPLSPQLVIGMFNMLKYAKRDSNWFHKAVQKVCANPSVEYCDTILKDMENAVAERASKEAQDEHSGNPR